MRRVLPADQFGEWWRSYICCSNDVEESGAWERWLTPVNCRDRSDGKLSHLDGLNWSRAWMLDAIARALPEDDPTRESLCQAAEAHRQAGLRALGATEYASTHWIASFALYDLSGASGGE